MSRTRRCCSGSTASRTRQGANENLVPRVHGVVHPRPRHGYTETDVREGARALTGWRVHPRRRHRSFDAEPARHRVEEGPRGDREPRRGRFCNAVLAGPGRRDSSPPEVGAAGRRTRPRAAPTSTAWSPRTATSGTWGAMLGAMLTAPEFAAAQGSIVIRPVEWLVGSMRALRIPVKTDGGHDKKAAAGDAADWARCRSTRPTSAAGHPARPGCRRCGATGCRPPRRLPRPAT